MDLKKLEEMMLMAGVPRSFRKKTIKRLKEDAVAADIKDSMKDASQKDKGTDVNPLANGKVDEKEVKTYSSPFKKGQTVQYGGAKYKVEVPNAKADFVGIVPLDGGKVDLVRASKLSLVEQELKEWPEELEKIREKIAKEVDYIDVKPYSHNIVGLLLQQASEEFGNQAANDLIDEFDLESMGWSKVHESSELTEATATDSYAADNMEDLNKQVTSDDLEKLGNEAEKAVSGDEVDTLASSHSNVEDEMASDDVGNIGGTDLKVPANIKTALGEKIDELRKNAELVRTRDGALADWQDRTANFFDGLLTRLKHGSDENVKMAAVEAQRVTSPMRHELPSEVWDFFVRGGKMRSLSDHFKEVKNQ